MPAYGYGLWNNIWGYVAVKSDFNTIQGVKFHMPAETPGLGARIESEEIQARFEDKAIFDNGNLVSVVIQKGEGHDYADSPHKVDGMSGATLTGKSQQHVEGLSYLLREVFEEAFRKVLKQHLYKAQKQQK